MRAALVLAALLAAAPAGATEHYPHVQRGPTPIEPTHDPCHLFETENEFISFYLDTGEEKVPLKAPKVYFEDRADFVQGATHGAQLFRVGIADFLPVTRRGTRGRMGLKMDWISILLTRRVPLRNAAENKIQLYSGMSDKPFREFKKNRADYGLTQVDFAIKPYGEEVYLDLQGDDLEALITCDRDGRVPFPNCNLWFEDDPITVIVLFAKWELPNWRGVRDKTVRFITCMRDAARQ